MNNMVRNPSTNAVWTQQLLQQHAQVAVAIEMYTLPFYFTALSSINDTGPVGTTAKQVINSVCIEEMLHLELAANLCLALGVHPNFTKPAYGVTLKYLSATDPATNMHAVLNAKLDAFNKTTLDTMLNIEVPEEFQNTNNKTPNYPYNSIGGFYNALLGGIEMLGQAAFAHGLPHQQSIFASRGINTLISDVATAKTAINTIVEQGEGKAYSPVPTKPFNEKQFPIEPQFQLPGDPIDKKPLNEISHFGRFIHLQNLVKSGYPSVYPVLSNPTPLNPPYLSTQFSAFIDNLNATWAGKGTLNYGVMGSLYGLATASWASGRIPDWGVTAHIGN